MNKRFAITYTGRAKKSPLRSVVIIGLRRSLCDHVCLSVARSLCWLFCEQDYKSNHPISLKLWLCLPIKRILLTFVDDAVPDTDSGSLFHVPRCCEIAEFKRSSSISHRLQSPADFHDTRRNDWRRQENKSTLHRTLAVIRRTYGSRDPD